MASANHNHNTALTEWQNKAASELSKLATLQIIGTDRLARDLSSAGINAKLTPGETVTATVTVPDTAGLPHGCKRSDFSDTKLAELDAQAVRQSKAEVWRVIRSRVVNGYIDTENAVKVLTALDYRPADMPGEQTSVTVRIPTSQRDRYGDLVDETYGFNLPGHVDKAEITASVASAFPTNADTLIALFPTADGIGQPRRVSVNYRTEWPDTCEFDQPASE